MACMANILHILIWVKFISMIFMYVQSGTHRFSLKNNCGFNTKFYCSDVCWYHRRPQSLTEICRNLSIGCGFITVAANGKYPWFVLFHPVPPSDIANKLKLSNTRKSTRYDNTPAKLLRIVHDELAPPISNLISCAMKLLYFLIH